MPRSERRTKGRQVPGEQYLALRPGSAIWQISFRIGHARFRASSRTTNRIDAAALAEREWQAVWRQVNLGEVPPDEMTLNEAFGRYFVECCRGTPYGERTQRYNLRVLLRVLGRNQLLSDLSDTTVNGAVQWLRTRPPARAGQAAALSPSTINRYLTTLSVVCRRATDIWGVRVGPWRKAKHVLREPEGREVFLDHAQAKRLIAASPGHLRPILLLSLMTGLRRENAIRLQWETVSLDLARAVLIQKGGRRLTISLPPPAVRLLSALQPDETARQGAVFRFANPNAPCACPHCANKAGRYVGEPIRSVKRAFATACAAAKVPEGLRFHDLRHSFASWLLDRGGDLVVVQKALGHRNVATTARYAHLMPGRKEAVIADVAEQLADDVASHTSGHNGRRRRVK